MYTTTLLSVASLCAVVLAGPHFERRGDTSAIAYSLSEIEASLLPPASLASQLTGIPSSVQSLANDATGLSQLISEFETSQPAWFTSLSPAAQSYILNNGAARESAIPIVSSLEAQLTAAPSTVVQTGLSNATTIASGGSKTAKSTSAGNSTVTTKKLTSTASETEKTSTATSESIQLKTTPVAAPSSSSSKAGAAQATGAIAVGLVGAAGFMGMVMAL